MKLIVWLIWAFLFMVSPSTKLTQVEAKLDELKRVLIEFRHELEIRENVMNTERWLATIDEKLRKLNNEEATALWNFETNMNNETSHKKVEVFMRGSAINKDIVMAAKKKLKNQRGLSEDTKRTLRILSTFSDPKNKKNLEQLENIKSKLENVYATATLKKDGKEYNMEPELTQLFKNERDPEVLEWAWKGWRDITGKKMKTDYTEFVRLANIGAHDNDFSDFGEFWREQQFDNTTDLLNIGAKLWEGIFPLYKKLHAYVRLKLKEYYRVNFPDYVFPNDTIPAHLLGNMWAQEWQNIYDIVKPYPDILEEDVTQAMKFHKYDVNKLFKTAEEFYTSLGLEPMTETFWEKSMLTRPHDRVVQCHASASDFFTNEPDRRKDDFRIKMCTEINSNYFSTIHHEMGHIQYFMEYRDKPAMFREGANSAFHEAIGDTISLSVETRKHLQAIGLMPVDSTQNQEDLKRKDLNTLMKQALFKIAFLPFGYLIDLWRFKVFDGTIREQDYNEMWWNLRLKYQGISPPVKRTRDDFDPGAKFHVAVNSPYFCYFISFIVQFQFYESLCKESGHTGPLHSCDYYQSRDAGYKLKSFLKLGKSRPWREAMKVLTGSKKISTDAIMKYFRPLEEWLETQINTDELGWKNAVMSFNITYFI